jgi:hypothetical protein
MIKLFSFQQEWCNIYKSINTTPKQNKGQKKSHDNLSRCINAFERIEKPFIIALNKLLIEGIFLNIIKPKVVTSGGKMRPFPLKSETRQGVHIPHSYSF